MGISAKTNEGVAAPTSPLVCTQCGAGVEHLTMDAQIIVTFRIDSEGRIDKLKNASSEIELIERASQEGLDHKNMFCDECGHYMGIKIDDEGRIIGFNDNPPNKELIICSSCSPY